MSNHALRQQRSFPSGDLGTWGNRLSTFSVLLCLVWVLLSLRGARAQSHPMAETGTPLAATSRHPTYATHSLRGSRTTTARDNTTTLVRCGLVVAGAIGLVIGLAVAVTPSHRDGIECGSLITQNSDPICAPSHEGRFQVAIPATVVGMTMLVFGAMKPPEYDSQEVTRLHVDRAPRLAVAAPV
jgi:hypothetical protein